jgi:hypothetical protein
MIDMRRRSSGGRGGWPGRASILKISCTTSFWSSCAAQRSLAVGEECEERARAAAIVISTWWPVGPAPVARADVRAEPRTRTIGKGESSPRFAMAAGGFASMISAGVAPGARVEATWAPEARAFAVRLSMTWTGSQGGRLGPGEAHWTRATTEIGPTYSRGILRVDAGAVASLFWIQGSGFAVNQTSTGAAAGSTAGARVGWARGRLSPWLELRGFVWPQSQRIYVTDASTDVETSRPMPHWELQLGAGIASSLL